MSLRRAVCVHSRSLYQRQKGFEGRNLYPLHVDAGLANENVAYR